DQDRPACVSRTPTGVVLYDRTLGPSDDRPPRRRRHKQPLEQSSARDLVAKQRQPTPSMPQYVGVQGRKALWQIGEVACIHRREWPNDFSWRIFDPAGRPRGLCGGSAQAVRGICPGGVARGAGYGWRCPVTRAAGRALERMTFLRIVIPL